MFTDNLFTKPTALNQAVDECLEALNDLAVGTEEYSKALEQLSKLYKLKESDWKLILQEMELKHKIEAQAIECEMKERELLLRVEEFGHKVAAHEVDTRLKEDDQKLKEDDLGLKRKVFEAEEEMRELNLEEKKRQLKIPFGIKPETVALIAANLLGIAIIVGHERLNVVTTKAVGFVTKLKN